MHLGASNQASLAGLFAEPVEMLVVGRQLSGPRLESPGTATGQVEGTLPPLFLLSHEPQASTNDLGLSLSGRPLQLFKRRTIRVREPGMDITLHPLTAANSILARHFVPGDATGIDLAKRINSSTAAAVDRLGAVSDGIRAAVDQDHSRAQRAYERSEWVTGIAAATSFLLMATGVFIIGRFLTRSIDRLVEGAARFAAGDRDHRIEIRVPPELHKVAEEFNHMIGRIRDSEATLSDLARPDRLTGLLNRRAFDEALPAALAQRRRRNEDVALLMLDLDHFKQINDTYGHAAGDAVLRAAAAEMVSNLREDDKTFRIGGEEFAALLRGADRAAAEKKAERLRATIAARRVAADGHDVAVTVSIGVAVPRDDIDAEDFLKAADAALYRAKTEGRNRIAMARD